MSSFGNDLYRSFAPKIELLSQNFSLIITWKNNNTDEWKKRANICGIILAEQNFCDGKWD